MFHSVEKILKKTNENNRKIPLVKTIRVRDNGRNNTSDGLTGINGTKCLGIVEKQ